MEVAGPLGTPLGLAQRKRRLDSLDAAQGAPRDPRRDSRGERSPWLPLETRPDSPVLSGPLRASTAPSSAPAGSVAHFYDRADDQKGGKEG